MSKGYLNTYKGYVYSHWPSMKKIYKVRTKLKKLLAPSYEWDIKKVE